MATAVARRIAELISSRRAEGRPCTLGLATGSTPVGVYQELVRMHRDEGLSLHNVVTFNLDEYYPMQPHELQSYVRFMNEHLFDHVDIPKQNINIPDGTLPVEAVSGYCRRYEEKIAEAIGWLGMAHLRTGDHEKAVALLLEVTEQYSGQVELTFSAYGNLIRYARGSGKVRDLDRHIADVQRYARSLIHDGKDAEYPWLYRRMSQLMVMGGYEAEAKEWAEIQAQ